MEGRARSPSNRLNKIVAVGVGQVDLSKGWVGYTVYEVG